MRVELAVVLTQQGERCAARRLLERTLQTLDLGRHPADAAHCLLWSDALTAIGNLDYAESCFQAASDRFAQAVELLVASGQAQSEALARGWRNVAVAAAALNQPHRAIECLRRALEVPAPIAELHEARFSLANAFEAIGEYANAEPIYLELRGATTGALLVRVLGSLAILQETTGDLSGARDAYRAAIAEAAEVDGDRTILAVVLVNAATLHAETAAYPEAERLLRRARSWTRRHPSPRFEIQYLNVRAELALARGQVGHALRTYRILAERAALIYGRGSSVVLTVRRTIADLLWSRDGAGAAYAELAAALRDCEAPPEDPEPVVSRAAQAMLAHEMGEPAATSMARASFTDELRLGVPELRWRLLLLLARLSARPARNDGAILLGKLAVNGILSLGASFAASGGSAVFYAHQRRPAFRALIEWLARAKRLPEADRVHQAVRQDELFDLVRRDERFASAIPALPLSEWEQAMADRLAALSGASRDRAETPCAEHEHALPEWLDEVQRGPTAPAAPTMPPEPDFLPLPGEATLRYTDREGGTLLSVSTAQGRWHGDIAAAPSELAELCHAFRTSILERTPEAIKIGAQLYTLLIQPALPHLAGVHLLRIAPDGALRYIPFAALNDGQSFLLQGWSLVHVSGAEARRASARSRRDWRVAAFGVTALEHVSHELQAVREAVPASILLDDAFTRDALAAALRGRFEVMHIASHFRLDPAWAARSALELGAGDAMSLDEFRAPRFDFSGIDLLVLSACDTGVLAPDRHGPDSLAGLFQLRGARSVLATLWPIADASAAALVSAFYCHAFANLEMTLSQVLRNAQLDLLTELACEGDHARTGLGLGRGPAYRHPYHWAAHVLFDAA